MSDEKGLRPEYLVVLLCALEALIEQSRSVAGKLQSLPHSVGMQTPDELREQALTLERLVKRVHRAVANVKRAAVHESELLQKVRDDATNTSYVDEKNWSARWGGLPGVKDLLHASRVLHDLMPSFIVVPRADTSSRPLPLRYGRNNTPFRRSWNESALLRALKSALRAESHPDEIESCSRCTAYLSARHGIETLVIGHGPDTCVFDWNGEFDYAAPGASFASQYLDSIVLEDDSKGEV